MISITFLKVIVLPLHLPYMCLSNHELFNRFSPTMDTRDPLFPDFSISKSLEKFKAPPCQPPRGRDVLERYFDVLYARPKGKRKGDDAALQVAEELIQLWGVGDARIPLITVYPLKKKINDFRDDLQYLCNKSKMNRGNYTEKVSF